MKAEFKKDSKEFQLFGDFYQLLKTYYEHEESLEWYDKWLTDLEEFWKKYGVVKSRKYQQKDKPALLAYILGFALADFIDNVAYNRL
jgi:hypothetical protein